MPTCNGVILWHSVMTVYLLAIVFKQILIYNWYCTSWPSIHRLPSRSLGILLDLILCQFLSRVSTLTRDIDIAILSVCLSVRPSVCP